MARFLILASALCLVAAPVTAQETAATDAQGGQSATPAKPKKICRSTVTTGRRIAQRQCYTAEQWVDYDRTQNEAAKKMIGDVTAAGGKSSVAASGNGMLSTGAVFGLGQ